MAKYFTPIFIVLGFLISWQNSAAQNTIKPKQDTVFYYPNGNKQSEGPMVDGKPEGYWRTYYENGVIKSEGRRANFLLDSIWFFYDEEGEKVLSIEYAGGMKNGVRTTWRDKEFVTEQFVDDIKQGLSTWYYPDSSIFKTIPFVDGREDGLAKEFADDGRVLSLTTYKKGFVVSRERINRLDAEGRKQGPWKFFHDNGLVKIEGKYLNDLKDGYFKEYDESGKLLATSKWVEGKKQEDAAELVRLEVAKDYYPNGQVMTMQTFRNGIAQGLRRDFDEDGKVSGGAVFEDGIKIAEGITLTDGVRQGDWKEYYKNGMLKAEGSYKDGEKTGLWNYYHPNGQLEQTGKYDAKGRLAGPWIWYYPSGNILREENYINGLADGLMTEYDEEGNIIAEGEYIEDMEEGPWVYQYGDYREEGSYSYGYRNGYWKYFDKNGSLLFEGEFIDNNPNGKHLFYWDNGRVKDEIQYLMGRKDGDWKKYNYDGSLLLVISYENGIEQKYDGVKITPAFTEPLDSPYTEEEE